MFQFRSPLCVVRKNTHRRMKVFLLTCLLGAAVLASDDSKMLDDLDVDALLNNEEQWKATFACLTGKVPCGDMQKLKDAAIKRLESKCGQCTPQQLDKYNHALKVIHDKYPEDHKEILKIGTKKE